MKELVSQARNVFAVSKENGLQPMVEMILTVSEAKYTADEMGHMVRSRAVETFRYQTTPHGLREQAKFLTEAEKIREAGQREADRPDGEPLK